MLILKTIAAILLQVALLGLLLLLPADSWLWRDAIIFLLFYVVLVTPFAIYLCVYYPEGIKARFDFSSSNQPTADRLATLVLVLSAIVFFVFTSVDVFDLTIFPPPSFAIKLLGLGLSALGLILTLVVKAQNAYAKPIVDIQKNKGQVLIDTGLYAHVRHPMYTGVLLVLSGMALWLGSIFTAIFGTVLFFLAFLPRIFIEEKTLKNDLRGYEDYMQRVKYRMIPKLF